MRTSSQGVAEEIWLSRRTSIVGDKYKDDGTYIEPPNMLRRFQSLLRGTHVRV
jgi:hypothetical protein